MQLVRSAAASAGQGTLRVEPRLRLVADAAAAVLVLAIAIALSVYKPQGMTPFGIRAESSGAVRVANATAFTYLFWLTIGALVVAIVVRHLLGGGMQSHFQ